MKRTVSMFAALGLFAASAFAQEGATDPQELMRQVKRNLQKIEDELNRMKATPSEGAPDAASRAAELDKLKRRQEQVVKDIDKIIEQMKQQGGGGGSSSDDQKQDDSGKSGKEQSKSKPKSRDRNKSQKDGQDQQAKNDKKPGGDKKEGGDKKDGESGKKPDGGKEDNSKKDGSKPENAKGPAPQQDPRKRAQHVDVNEIWGVLPPELRQKLVDRNFGEFTPEYEDEVREYLKKVSSGR